MSDLTLYQITNKFVVFLEKENELTEDEINVLGEELALLLRKKSSDIIGYTRNIEGFIAAAKAEEERIKNMRQTAENRLERFKEYVKSNMERLHLIKIETELGTLTICKNPISVEIVSEDDVPDEYKEKVVTYKINKKLISKHYKSCNIIPAGTIIHSENTSLRIK